MQEAWVLCSFIVSTLWRFCMSISYYCKVCYFSYLTSTIRYFNQYCCDIKIPSMKVSFFQKEFFPSFFSIFESGVGKYTTCLLLQHVVVYNIIKYQQMSNCNHEYNFLRFFYCMTLGVENTLKFFFTSIT